MCVRVRVCSHVGIIYVESKGLYIALVILCVLEHNANIDK